MKFTRAQELALIELGFQTLLANLTEGKVVKKETPKRTVKKGRKWSDSQRKKYSKSMKAYWMKKKAAQD